MERRVRNDGSEVGYGGCFLLIWMMTHPLGAIGAFLAALVVEDAVS
jgi:hypothetical protein